MELMRIKKFFETRDITIQDIENIKVPSGSMFSFTDDIAKSTRKRKIFSIKDNGITWENIFGKNYEATCKICEKNKMEALNKETWHMGHIVAFAEGGSDDLDNMRPICVECNKSMGKKHLVEYCKEKYPDRWKKILMELKIRI